MNFFQKTKSIQQIWEESFPDAILAGGAIRSEYDSTSLVDYDFYFNSFADSKSALLQLTNEYPVRNVLSYNDVFSCEIFDNKIQLISIYQFENPFDLIHNFDITATMAARTLNGKTYATSQFITDTRHKCLRFNQIKNLPKTMLRVQKYISKGYSLSYDAVSSIITTARQANESELEVQLKNMFGSTY
jgi:hypothetical protein